MELNEFLLNTPKLNEIPKPGIKSHFKMAPKGEEFNYEINNNLRFVAYDNVNLSNKKNFTFLSYKKSF